MRAPTEDEIRDYRLDAADPENARLNWQEWRAHIGESEGAAPRAEGLPSEDVDDLVQDIAGGIDGEPYLDRSGWERAHASLKVLAAAARRPSDERVPESEER